MRKFLLLTLLLLGACAQPGGTPSVQSTIANVGPALNAIMVGVQKFTAADITNALALSNASGDTNAVQCWTTLQNVLAANKAAGLASTVELSRIGQQLAQGPCAPVFAGASSMVQSIIQLAPAGLIP